MAHSVNDDIQSTDANLVNQLAIILRTAHIHSTNNVAFAKAASKFITIINGKLRKETALALELRGDFFYLNDSRIRYSPKYFFNFNYLAREFRKIELGKINFIDKLVLEDAKTFIYSIVETDFMHESFRALSNRLSELAAIDVEKLKEIITDEEVDVRKMVKKTYFNAVHYVKGVFSKINKGESVEVKRAKRVVSAVVNAITEHEQILMGMTALKDYDEYTYFHSANVSILSVALGRRMGMSRNMLTELGIAALFHDIGKIDVPNEVLNKPSNLLEAEWKTMQKHPIWGVKSLLKMRSIDDLTIRSSMVAFEHHMNLNHSGYPRLKKQYDLDFFSRIVSIADRYDAMTSSRVYSRISMPLDKALGIMMEKTGDEIDPLLFKFFINMVGMYPIGTLVGLDSKELGLVFENDQASLLRPRVMLITDNQGNWIKGHVVDLNEKDDTGQHLRTIMKTVDANKYKINLAEYLM